MRLRLDQVSPPLVRGLSWTRTSAIQYSVDGAQFQICPFLRAEEGKARKKDQGRPALALLTVPGICVSASEPYGDGPYHCEKAVTALAARSATA